MIRIDNEYLYFDTAKTIYDKKKMTGHDFVELLELNPFNKKGDKILSIFKIYKPPFDNKYLYRGDYAESLVRYYYQKQKRPFVWYDENAKKQNNYDFFPTYKQCGGIPDLEMQDEEEIIEVKSKSMKDYDNIANNKNIPLQELYQALFYGYLRKTKKVTMFYVFFDEETEQLIFNKQQPKTLNNIKLYKKTYNMNDYYNDVESKIKEALHYYNKCVYEKKIPLKDISEKVLNEVRSQYGI